MTEIQPFTFPETGQGVRSLTVDGEPWFVAADVAEILGLGNIHSSLASLDDDEKGLHTMETPGGQQHYVAVNEPGLYSLILRSRKKQAKAFKRWITHEVIPAIRRTGSYGVPAQLSRKDLARMVIEAEDARELAEVRAGRAEAKALEMAPAANTGADVDAAFVQVVQLPGAGNLGDQRRYDYELSRFACYLVAMNGDPRKLEVAQAQAYFAVRAREAETAAPVATSVKIEIAVNALARVAHREHVVPVAGRVLAYERWNKPAKGMQAFAQLTIDLSLLGLDDDSAQVKALPRKRRRGEAA